MSNPVFDKSPVFSERPPSGVTNPGAQATAAYPATDAATLQTMYDAPTATTRDTGRLTYDDVIIKTGGLFAVLLVAAAITWQLSDAMPGLWVGGMVVGLALGLVNAFKRQPSPALILLYGVAEGVFLGGLSKVYNDWYDGIVVQAVLATFATFAAALVLFRSGKVRVTPKFTRWLLVAMTGYLVFSLVNLVLVWTGVLGGWGLRGGGFGVVIGLLAVGMAAASLLVDFDAIKRGVERGAPAKMAWSAAFGLVVTLIWLYTEILRILAILRN
ncbi:Bax inhibitor-1/YccA family protein [Luteimicrobium subarcticum]|uniref:Putative YccA/Bax inhibitor family protein n=1 Tax=Luteimicrobium subarcticum TaxID=620910 RepID=A0A2M8WTE3_9MICO|nr:Bax inhibitor-1/YccA family protein [Luteimicrobium subarcticum]PJI94148.1 putative YccA/Bax inhibitor family protein [Luteimicrobium subarcticum]